MHILSIGVAAPINNGSQAWLQDRQRQDLNLNHRPTLRPGAAVYTDHKGEGDSSSFGRWFKSNTAYQRIKGLAK